MATATAAPAPTFDELLLRATSCLEQASALRAQGLTSAARGALSECADLAMRARGCASPAFAPALAA